MTTCIVCLIAVAALLAVASYNKDRKMKKPPVFRYTGWPKPEDRPGAYVNDEPIDKSEKR